MQDQIKDLMPTLKKETEDIFENHVKYFEPVSYENIIEESEYEDLKTKLETALSNNNVLDINGKEIVNNVGKIVYKKTGGDWSEKKITKLGVKIATGEKIFSEHTSEEKEEIKNSLETQRISSLSSQEKTTEKNNRNNKLLAIASDMKNKLEIQNDPDALTKSQNWYNAELALLETKYQ